MSQHYHFIIHQLFEVLAYFVGGTLFRRNLKQNSLNKTSTDSKLALFLGLTIGALIGSKLLAFLNYADALVVLPISQWFQGKTIVGGLIGGMIGLEIAKKLSHVKQSTGDMVTIPLIIAILIGRIGCAQSGLGDYTFGNPTTLPWGVNFGDNIPRHPTAVYEIIFLALLAIICSSSNLI